MMRPALDVGKGTLKEQGHPLVHSGQLKVGGSFKLALVLFEKFDILYVLFLRPSRPSRWPVPLGHLILLLTLTTGVSSLHWGCLRS